MLFLNQSFRCFYTMTVSSTNNNGNRRSSERKLKLKVCILFLSANADGTTKLKVEQVVNRIELYLEVHEGSIYLGISRDKLTMLQKE
jgi:hypothetical protein